MKNIIDADGVQAIDDRFELITSFDVVVPENYDHATRLDSFKRKHDKDFFCYSNAITDKNFARTTMKLIPGRKIKADIYRITRRASSEDCITFLKSHNAIFVGAQGASLAYEQGKSQLFKGHWHISFDEKDALWKDADGYHRVPCVFRDSNGDFKFELGYFTGKWDSNHCLFCFREY
ncbi:MAG: hypothetical protein AAB793_00680, partial [Patescibacteria group bacterium]